MNNSEDKIVLTGGGSSGHVTFHLALIPELLSSGYEIYYLGTDNIEHKLITKNFSHSVKFFKIKAGKLRRYISFESFLYTLRDFLYLFIGFFQSLFYLCKIRPKAIISRGGYVSLPVVVSGFLLKIPIFLHEADYSLSLSSKLTIPLSKKVFYTFPATINFIKNKDNAIHSGLAIRKDIHGGCKLKGYELCHFYHSYNNDQSYKTINKNKVNTKTKTKTENQTKNLINSTKKQLNLKPVVLIMAGSQGSNFINNVVSRELINLVKKYRIIYLAGTSKNFLDFSGKDLYITKDKNSLFCKNSIACFGYLHDDLKDIYQIVDFAISRAGANSIFELLSLNIPTLYIPLQRGSRGEQIHNANYIKKLGLCITASESELLAEKTLVDLMKELEINNEKIKKALKDYYVSFEKNTLGIVLKELSKL